MNKTILNAFICSFSVSLLTIFAVNKVYFDVSDNKNVEVKLPQKNVVLFLKSGITNSSHYALPTKKIALNTLPELSSVGGGVEDEPEIILADNFDEDEIPLEISQTLPEVFAVSEKAVGQKQVAAITPKVDDAIVAEVKKEVEKVSIPLDVPIQASSIVPRKVEVSKSEEIKVVGLEKPTLEPLGERREPKLLLPIERGKAFSPFGDTEVYIGDADKISQVALVNKNIPISGVVKSQPYALEVKDVPQQWKSMEEQYKSPWLEAKARGVKKNNLLNVSGIEEENRQIGEAVSPKNDSGQGVKLAAEAIQNLIIPIPEKIINQENLVPRLSFGADSSSDAEVAVQSDSAKEEKAKNKLLTSISSIFGGDKKDSSGKKEGILDNAKKTINKIKDKISSSDDMGRIMPTEMRLSFQPGRAEISGQTLRWIRAFATRVVADTLVAVEIRRDGTTASSLQQKRLNLLHNILANKGVSLNKINTVFTQREPNSFIIKLVSTVANGKDVETRRVTQGYYQYW